MVKPYKPSNEPSATPRDEDPQLPDGPTTESPIKPGSNAVDLAQFETGTGHN